MRSSLCTCTKLDYWPWYWPAGLSKWDNDIALPPHDHLAVQIRISTWQCASFILHHTISALASGAGTCVDIEDIWERSIHTLNDIQFCKCGSLFGVDAVARRSQGIVGVEKTRVRRPTTAKPVMEHIPRKTTSQLVSMNLCVQETLPVVDALLEEPMINQRSLVLTKREAMDLLTLEHPQ